jgi:hypothetical protein
VIAPGTLVWVKKGMHTTYVDRPLDVRYVRVEQPAVALVVRQGGDRFIDRVVLLDGQLLVVDLRLLEVL